MRLPSTPAAALVAETARMLARLGVADDGGARNGVRQHPVRALHPAGCLHGREGHRQAWYTMLPGCPMFSLDPAGRWSVVCQTTLVKCNHVVALGPWSKVACRRRVTCRVARSCGSAGVHERCGPRSDI